MSLIIPGELPTCCSDCDFHNGCGYCYIVGDGRVDYQSDERPKNCVREVRTVKGLIEAIETDSIISRYKNVLTDRIVQIIKDYCGA